MSINDWAARAAREIKDQSRPSVDRIAAIIALHARPLTDALRVSRREHYHCGDSWYCCGACEHSDHCGYPLGEGADGRREGLCNCGADAHNARIDEALNS